MIVTIEDAVREDVVGSKDKRRHQCGESVGNPGSMQLVRAVFCARCNEPVKKVILLNFSHKIPEHEILKW